MCVVEKIETIKYCCCSCCVSSYNSTCGNCFCRYDDLVSNVLAKFLCPAYNYNYLVSENLPLKEHRNRTELVLSDILRE